MLCAGNIRTASKKSFFLLHPLKRVFEKEELESKDLDQNAKDLKALEKRYKNMVCETTGLSSENFDVYYKKAEYFSANIAYKLGLLTRKPR